MTLKGKGQLLVSDHWLDSPHKTGPLVSFYGDDRSPFLLKSLNIV
jgi:hypothetical protein